jgi:ATP-dependent exoDNAse (exonuclease V) alpha subunit
MVPAPSRRKPILARDIRGIGFKTADAVAMKLGIEKTATIRVRPGISYALAEAMDEGHCGLPTEELVPLAEKRLEGEQQLIRNALDRNVSGRSGGRKLSEWLRPKPPASRQFGMAS